MAKKFKLSGGQHQQQGKLYKNGDVIETDLNLPEMFPGKFQQVGHDTPVTKAREIPDDIVQVHENPPDLKDETGDTPVDDGIDRGKDVTAKHPSAVENDYLVFIKKRKHYIYDPDNMTEPKAGPILKPEVKKTIKRLLEEVE